MAYILPKSALRQAYDSKGGRHLQQNKMALATPRGLTMSDSNQATEAPYPETNTPPGAGSKPLGRVRWGMATLLGFGILINYIDRLSVSLVATPLTHEFGLTATDFGIIGSAFVWTYAIMQIPSGVLLDRLGSKWIWRIGMLIWACASFLTAVASGFWVIIVARLLLGVAEAPAFPGAMKATGTWFPLNERSLATAIFDTGTRLANVIGLPLIAFVVTYWGWREAFVAQGILSIIYLAVFWVKYREPDEKYQEGNLTEAEYRHIVDGGGTVAKNKSFNRDDFVYLLRQRKVWGLSLGLAGVGYVLWMLFTWLPGYLQMGYDQTVLESGMYTAIPGIVMFLIEITIGGILVDRLITKGYDANKVRKTVLICGFLMAFLTVGAAFSHSATEAIIWIALGSGGIALVYVVCNSIPAMIAPEGDTGSVAAIMNCVNLLAGIVAPVVTGLIVDATGHFAYAFIVGGVAMVFGLLCLLLMMGKIEAIPGRKEVTTNR